MTDLLADAGYSNGLNYKFLNKEGLPDGYSYLACINLKFNPVNHYQFS